MVCLRVFCFSFVRIFVIPFAWGCCFDVPLAQCYCCFTFFLLKTTTLLLLHDMLLCSSCLIYCSAPLVQCATLLLLFDLLFCSSCFKLIGAPPPFFFASVEEPSKFKFFKQDLEGGNIFFNLCLLMSFFTYPCFWEMVVDNVFIYYVQELFGHCTFIIHIASFFLISFNCL